MANAYPAILTKTTKGFLVYIPDFDCNTEGRDEADAIVMARDVIELMGVDYIDDGKELPHPAPLGSLIGKGDIVTLNDVDFDSYRKKIVNKTIRKNLTIPLWLNEGAEKAGVNFSAVLQSALKERLGL